MIKDLRLPSGKLGVRFGAVLASLACAGLVGCATGDKRVMGDLPVLPPTTSSQQALFDLPRPARPVSVAVYGFTDQTGQFKPTETGQTLSRAVSQGGTAILVKALQDAGDRRWFMVVEREQLKNLLTERQIIQEMRGRYLGETEVNPDALPSLLFAGVILEGGVIGYDTNTMTGGAGAGFLGISASKQYREDTVTVSLRAISVRTGEVLASVNASKTIASYSIGVNAFKYVTYKELLETEIGTTTNEPDQLALQQAVEKGVYALIMEGVDLKLWSFADVDAGWPYLYRYRQEREGALSATQVARAERSERKGKPKRPRYEEDASLNRRRAPQAASAAVRPAEQGRASTNRAANTNRAPAGDPIGDLVAATSSAVDASDASRTQGAAQSTARP